MDNALWVIQIVLGIKLLSVSYTHGLRQSGPEMQAAIGRGGTSLPRILKAVAVCVFAGALGLVLPDLLGAPVWVTSVVAGAVAAMLLISIWLHIRYRERPKIYADIVLLILAAAAIYGRWSLLP